MIDTVCLVALWKARLIHITVENLMKTFYQSVTNECISFSFTFFA